MVRVHQKGMEEPWSLATCRCEAAARQSVTPSGGRFRCEKTRTDSRFRPGSMDDQAMPMMRDERLPPLAQWF